MGEENKGVYIKMILNRSGKKTIASIGMAVFAFTVGISVLQPIKAEAFDIGSAAGAILGSVVQYNQFNKELNYYNNDGRNEYFEEIKKKDGVDENSYKNEMLETIMTRLSTSIAQTDTSIISKPYNYFVNKQTTFNAYCTLGHNMSVNAGLFDLLNYNENEVAFVVGHEMGHGQKDHPVQGFKKAVPVNIIANVWGSQTSGVASSSVNVLANYATAVNITKPQEWEADNLAFGYAVGAGYNPGAGAAVWQRVIEKMGSSSSNFVGEIFSPSDHPKNEERRENYSKKLTEYSNQHVTVANGAIKVNGKDFMTAGATNSMSSEERAYLIAGNLAAVYHNNTVAPEAYVENGFVKMGDQAILAPNGNEADADALADKLNHIR